ncbi:MAG: DNA-directed RNA polymerase specialized sigma24 family protein [Vicingaceae bacterium]|jgi:DNA-directed RNA polymerase specialized sigma24 family protein
MTNVMLKIVWQLIKVILVLESRDHLYQELLNTRSMQSNASLSQNKKEFRLFVTTSFSNLVQFKEEGDKTSFNKLVLEIIPELRRYVNGRLSTALQKGHFPKGKYKADDFIDQLFIEIYDHIEAVENQEYFYLWLYKKVNQLLDDSIVEEEFDDVFFQNIDDYSKPEWDEMEEKFSTDGGGDLLLIEELDDLSYNHNDYELNHVFVEDKEKELIEKLDKELSAEKVQRHIAMVLYNLPSKMRSVFELTTLQHMGMEEVAELQNSTLEAVKELYHGAQKALRLSFLNRYAAE